MIFAGFAIAAAVVGTSAQGLSSLSSSCQAGAASILIGPATTCLNIPGIVSIATTPSDQSLIAPIDSWLTSTCAQPACTNDTIDATISSITTGCSTDLSAAGVSDSLIERVASEIKEWYSTGREVACLKETTTDAFCITSTLRAFEEWTGSPLSVDALTRLAPELRNSAIPTNMICTPCAQAAYALIGPKLDDSTRSTVDDHLGGQCGANFVDGSSPVSIKQTANAAVTVDEPTPANGNGAMSFSSGILNSATLLFGVAGLVVLAL